MSKLEQNQQRYLVSREAMTTHLVEDRRAIVSPWGLGNSKLGAGVYTYSKPAGRAHSCPGATDHCERVCYAKRMTSNPWLRLLYEENAARGSVLPDLPADATLVRGHVSGDFDSVAYVVEWWALAAGRKDVQFWFYTRSWRVPEIYVALERLRALPNVQMWASMDPDSGLPPEGWRRAWLDSDERIGELAAKRAYRTPGGVVAPACPEETGEKANCVDCGYCFDTDRGDLVFLEHAPKPEQS